MRDRHLFLDRLDHVGGIGADARQRHAQYHFLAITRHRAEAQGGSLLDGRHITQINRRAVDRLDHNVAEIALAGNEAQSPHQILFESEVHVLAAHLTVVGLDHRHDVLVTEPVFDEPQRIDHHLELTFLTAPRHHVVDAGRGA